MLEDKGLISSLFKGEYQIRLIKFFLVGGLNYPLNLFLVWIGTEIVGLYYLFSVAIAYITITIMNYFWHSNYIFIVQRNRRIFFKYIVPQKLSKLMNMKGKIVLLNHLDY